MDELHRKRLCLSGLFRGGLVFWTRVAMSRKVYLVIFVLLAAVAVTGVYLRARTQAAAVAALRQRSGQAANCDSPAPPPPPTSPPPKLPGFAIEPACGTAAEAPKAPEKKK
jgi:hypothetical protein